MIRTIFIFIISIFIMVGCGTEGTQSSEPSNKKPVEDIPVIAEPAGENEDSEEAEVSVKEIQTSIDINTTDQATEFIMTLKNTSKEDMELTFTSGQKFEIVVKDKTGKEVYRYSIDKSFIMALQTVEIKAGEEVTWNESWDYLQTGERVPSGQYDVMVEVIATQLNGSDLSPGSIIIEGNVDVPKENIAFRNISVLGENGEYTITGEARVFEASFFYAVEEGHDYVIKETVFQTNEGAPSWSPFEFNLTVPQEKLPVNGTLMLEIYERSAKDGEIVNLVHMPLQSFNK